MTPIIDDTETWIAFCRHDDCDWSITVDEDDAMDPRSLAAGRALIHKSQSGPHWTTLAQSVPEESGPFDGGMRKCGVLDSEEELQEWLESYLESHGWEVNREVSPEGSEYRAYLIARYGDIVTVGIETKYFRRDGGAKLAEAHHQITRKYRFGVFQGDVVDLWALCPYFWGMNSPDYITKRDQQKVRSSVAHEFFGKHGIGYIDLDRDPVLIDFVQSDDSQKIPIGGDRVDRYQKAVDIDEIRDGVWRKAKKYDYRSVSNRNEVVGTKNHSSE